MQQLFCLRFLKLFSFLTLLSLLPMGTTFAQQAKNTFGASQRNRPTTSPFLNMIDNGNGTPDGGSGLSYFNLVKPIQQGRRANQKLQRELQAVESSITRVPGRGASNSNSLGSIPITTGRMPQTGHAAGFNDLQGRFGGGGGRSSGGGGGGGNSFGSQPSGGLGIRNNLFGGNATPNGILGGR